MAKQTKTKKASIKKTAKTKKAEKNSAKSKEKKLKTVKTRVKPKTQKKVVQVSEPEKKTRKKTSKVSSAEVTEIKTTVIPRKPAYPKKELEYFKKIILEKRREIIEQLESLRERMIDESGEGFVNENSPYSLHMADQGTDAFEKEKNYLWAQRETKFLSYLDAALKRIEEGTYGYCIDCGKVIEKGRLEAVPHTQHCVECKVKFSKK